MILQNYIQKVLSGLKQNYIQKVLIGLKIYHAMRQL